MVVDDKAEAFAEVTSATPNGDQLEKGEDGNLADGLSSVIGHFTYLAFNHRYLLVLTHYAVHVPQQIERQSDADTVLRYLCFFQLSRRALLLLR